MVTFTNAYSASALANQAYLNCITAAENFISSHWTDSITINMSWDAQAKGTSNTFLASNSWPAFVNVSYTTLRNALAAHATNPDAQAAVATLPASDPSGGHTWSLTETYARMLGLSSTVYTPDDTVTLNTSYAWSYGQDVIDALEHEITEGGMGRVGGLGDQNNAYSVMDLFRYSAPSVRDFTDGRDGKTTYFSVDGNTLLLQYNNQYNGATHANTGDPADFNVLDVFGFGQPGNNSVAFSDTDYKVMNVLGWTPVGVAVGVNVEGVGDFNSNGNRDAVWRNSSAFMSIWDYDATTQKVTTTGLTTVDFGWAIFASGHFSNASTSEMLADRTSDGAMTVWWVSNGQLAGAYIGQDWNNIGFIASGQFTNDGGAGITNFLVTNKGDHHLYDWWIGAGNSLQGIDLGAAWSNIGFVAGGQFTSNGGTNFLVTNNGDHHLYDWWIGAGNSLQGIDLGAAWSGIGFVAGGQFTSNGGTNFLVTNLSDHHLYDWWISAGNSLQGIDLGAYWSPNIRLLTVGRFDSNSANTELLVRNTTDNHMYEWWITAQNKVAGVDLGAVWGNNIQLIDNGHFNNNSANNELLVRNSADGHFYEWWIASNQLQGADLGGASGGASTGGASPGTIASGNPPIDMFGGASPTPSNASVSVNYDPLVGNDNQAVMFGAESQFKL